MINKAEANAPDVVSMDVPFLTRVMEKCREDIKTDVDLHLLLEKIIAKAGTGTLTMKDYAQIEPADSQPEKEHAAKKPMPKPDPKWKNERLKGCKCPTSKVTNPKCPIHGTSASNILEVALVKGWKNYDKLKLKADLHCETKAGRSINLKKGEIIGLRLSSNGKLTRMITEQLGPTIVVTLTHVQADNVRKKSGRTA